MIFFLKIPIGDGFFDRKHALMNFVFDNEIFMGYSEKATQYPQAITGFAYDCESQNGIWVTEWDFPLYDFMAGTDYSLDWSDEIVIKLSSLKHDHRGIIFLNELFSS